MLLNTLLSLGTGSNRRALSCYLNHAMGIEEVLCLPAKKNVCSLWLWKELNDIWLGKYDPKSRPKIWNPPSSGSLKLSNLLGYWTTQQSETTEVEVLYEYISGRKKIRNVKYVLTIYVKYTVLRCYITFNILIINIFHSDKFHIHIVV